MKNTNATLTALTLAAGAILLAGCGKNETAPPAAITPKPEAAAKTPAKPYPLDVCLVSGEKLGSMGKPAVIVFEGQEIKFCCGACEPDFRKEPAKFLAKLPAKK